MADRDEKFSKLFTISQYIDSRVFGIAEFVFEDILTLTLINNKGPQGAETKNFEIIQHIVLSKSIKRLLQSLNAFLKLFLRHPYR